MVGDTVSIMTNELLFVRSSCVKVTFLPSEFVAVIENVTFPLGSLDDSQ